MSAFVDFTQRMSALRHE